MPTIIINCIATFSTVAFVVLWFWVARRELRIKQSMLESAKLQLFILREQYAQARNDPDAKGVLKRSLDIYDQSLERYNETFHKLWLFIPGVLMGFRKVKDREDRGVKP